MSEEDPNLSACMQKLKIMPRPRHVRIYRDEDQTKINNPFCRRFKPTASQSYTSIFGPSCQCKRVKNAKSLRRSTNHFKTKLLREPIIVFLDKKCKKCKTKTDQVFGANVQETQADFKSLIAGCERLTLDTADNNKTTNVVVANFPNQNYRDTTTPTPPQNNANDKSVNVNNNNNNNSSSCSQQAMARICLSPPCDVTIDELACYFDTLVHIPKKMSTMAEMMYI